MKASVQASHVVFALDCPDALALAQFYADLLGWVVRVDAADPDWVEVVAPAGDKSGFSLAFQQIEHYRMPEWPDGEVAQQAHLDFHVDSLQRAGAIAAAAGATKHLRQPLSDATFAVYTDPAGHPFCLCEV